MQSKWRLIGVIIWLVFFLCNLLLFFSIFLHRHRHTESSQFLASIQIQFFRAHWLWLGLTWLGECICTLGATIALLQLHKIVEIKLLDGIVQRTGIYVLKVCAFFFLFDFAFPLHLNFRGGHRTRTRSTVPLVKLLRKPLCADAHCTLHTAHTHLMLHYEIVRPVKVNKLLKKKKQQHSNSNSNNKHHSKHML